MNKQPKYEIGEEVKLQITLEVTAVVAGYEPDADENTYLYELVHMGYSPVNSDIFLSDEADGFELFDEKASIFREEELIGYNLYEVGEQVKYRGGDTNHWGRTYTIEYGIQYRPEYDPPGYYYDLDHPEMKRIHEAALSRA